MSFTREKNLTITLGKQIYLQNTKIVQKPKHIHIVFASDNNYAQHCAVTMASILLNSDNTSYFHFHILDGGISATNKRKIEYAKKIRMFSIQYYDMKLYDFSKFPLNRPWISVSTYYRLLMPQILPLDVDKVLYLDCDMVVERDIKELWNTDISEYSAAVVEDDCSKENMKRMKLPIKNKYFNAGMILFNLKEIRKSNFTDDCIKYFKKNEQKIILQDQDILNGVLNGKCKYVSQAWNTNFPIYQGSDSERHCFTRKEEIEECCHPGIIHYTTADSKPWINVKKNMASEYWKYFKYTGFYNIFQNIFSALLRLFRKRGVEIYSLYLLKFLPLFEVRELSCGITKKYYFLGIQLLKISRK
ncbi:MAG: glycosyltransferase family 8 protein [Alphaproteobacteria bacterium]|nr:glycosyltransferase family 8 protein [Alphaproteobacteria bacterium]